MRAVHGLQDVLFAFFGSVDGLERVLTILCIVTRSHIEALWTDVGRHHLLIAELLLNLLEEVFQAETEGCTLGHPHGKSLTYEVGEHEEFHFLTNLAVVATLGFFKELEVFIKHLFLGERDAVNACHLGALFVATPVGRTYAHHLECLDGSGSHQVRTTAKVGVSTLCVGRNLTVFEFFNEFVLVSLTTVGKELNSVSLWDVFTNECILLLHEFLHLLFNLRKVFFADAHALRGHHVVVETVFNSRTDTKLSAGPNFTDCFSHQVRRSVPKGVLRFSVFPLVEVDGSIFENGAVQLHRFAIHAACQHVLCKTTWNTFRNLQTSNAALVFTNATVRKSNFNHICF